jgi:hypothetical protein
MVATMPAIAIGMAATAPHGQNLGEARTVKEVFKRRCCWERRFQVSWRSLRSPSQA